jgi:hypothetical protein
VIKNGSLVSFNTTTTAQGEKASEEGTNPESSSRNEPEPQSSAGTNPPDIIPGIEGPGSDLIGSFYFKGTGDKDKSGNVINRAIGLSIYTLENRFTFRGAYKNNALMSSSGEDSWQAERIDANGMLEIYKGPWRNDKDGLSKEDTTCQADEQVPIATQRRQKRTGIWTKVDQDRPYHEYHEYRGEWKEGKRHGSGWQSEKWIDNRDDAAKTVLQKTQKGTWHQDRFVSGYQESDPRLQKSEAPSSKCNCLACGDLSERWYKIESVDDGCWCWENRQKKGLFKAYFAQDTCKTKELEAWVTWKENLSTIRWTDPPR